MVYKSPLTGFIGSSNCGGSWVVSFKRTGSLKDPLQIANLKCVAYMAIFCIACRVGGMVRLDNSIKPHFLEYFDRLQHVKLALIRKDLIELLYGAPNTAEVYTANTAFFTKMSNSFKSTSGIHHLAKATKA